MSFKDFEKDLEKFAKATDITIDQAIRSIKIDLFSSVILSTRVAAPWTWKHPVKGYIGGSLRGNWQCSNNTPKLNDIERKDKNGSDVINEVTSTVKSDTTDYLTNNLPYAEVWEEQDAMVAKNMQRINRFIKKSIRGTK